MARVRRIDCATFDCGCLQKKLVSTFCGRIFIIIFSVGALRTNYQENKMKNLKGKHVIYFLFIPLSLHRLNYVLRSLVRTAAVNVGISVASIAVPGPIKTHE